MPANVLSFARPDSPAPMAAPEPWWQIRMQGDGVAELDVRGFIGAPKWLEEEWGEPASGTVPEFDAALKALGEVREIRMNVHSFGGLMFEGLAMHNILARHPARIVARIDGVAASSASILVMAADEILMPENAYLMIHNATTWAAGDHRDLRAAADQVGKWTRDMANIYAARIEDNLGGERTEILARVIEMMDAETWLTGAEAVEAGLAEKALARVDLAACASPLPRPWLAAAGVDRERVPEALRSLVVDSAPMADASASEPEAPGAEEQHSPDMSLTTAPSAPPAAAADAPVEEPAAPAAEPVAAEPAAAPAEPAEPAEPAAAAAPAAATAPVAPAPVEAAAAALFAAPVADLSAQITAAVQAAVQPLAERLDAAEAEVQRQSELRAAGVPVAAWGNQPAAAVGEGGEAAQPDFASMTPEQKVRFARERQFPGFRPSA